VEEQCGIAELGEIIMSKRIRRAESVYGRHLPVPELREITEKII